jgi:hypothetical protein
MSNEVSKIEAYAVKKTQVVAKGSSSSDYSITTPAGFEPAPSKRNRFLICRRNHLAIAPMDISCAMMFSMYLWLLYNQDPIDFPVLL